MYEQDYAQILAGMLSQRMPFCNPSMSAIQAGMDYRIFTHVSIHCLTGSKTEPALARDRMNTPIDLLVCRGKEAILAVTFDWGDFEQEFAVCFHSLPHYFLKSEEMNEELAVKICDALEERLRCDMDEPAHTGWQLYALSLKMAAVRMKSPNLLDRLSHGGTVFLQRKNLVNAEGKVTPYGRSCGLFHSHTMHKRSYCIACQCTGTLHRALQWYDAAAENTSLQHRLSRLKDGLPVDSTQRQSETVRELLTMPLETYFLRYPQDLSHLRILLSRGQFLSMSSEVSAFGDREEIRTYGDVVYAVNNLWEYTAHRSCRNEEITGLCQEILTFLSFPLWSEPEIPAPECADPPSDDLQQRLHRVRQAVFLTPLSQMPLSYYFYGAACFAESEHPLWLYRVCIQPCLRFYGLEDCSCAQALHRVYSLSQSEEEYERADYFSLLYGILAEPFMGIL